MFGDNDSPAGWWEYLKTQPFSESAHVKKMLDRLSRWSMQSFDMLADFPDANRLTGAIGNYKEMATQRYMIMSSFISGQSSNFREFATAMIGATVNDAELYLWGESNLHKLGSFGLGQRPQSLADFEDLYQEVASDADLLNRFLIQSDVPTDGIFFVKGLQFTHDFSNCQPERTQAHELVSAFLSGDLLQYKGFYSASGSLMQAADFNSYDGPEDDEPVMTVSLKSHSPQNVRDRNQLRDMYAHHLSIHNGVAPATFMVTKGYLADGSYVPPTTSREEEDDEVELLHSSNHILIPQRVIVTKGCWLLIAHLTSSEPKPAKTWAPAEEKWPHLNEFDIEDVDNAIFDGGFDGRIPYSKLLGRETNRYGPKIDFDFLTPVGVGPYSGKLIVYEGSLTDIGSTSNRNLAIGDSNNGDLFTGCGFAVAKAVINAAGPGLQAELYNRFGAPSVMEVPLYAQERYGHTEGRGYAVSCSAHDMVQSHGIGTVEFMTVPMYDAVGVDNMYWEALCHSVDRDGIILPMAGMSHPVLNNDAEVSADFAVRAAKRFYDTFPESRLKIVFAIYDDPDAAESYRERIWDADFPAN